MNKEFKITNNNTLRFLAKLNIDPLTVKSEEQLNAIRGQNKNDYSRAYMKKQYREKDYVRYSNRFALRHILPQIVD